MAYREVPIATESCLECRKTVEAGTAVCPRCGQPIDVAAFAEIEFRLKPHLQRARNMLAFVATINLLLAGAAAVLLFDRGFEPLAALQLAAGLALAGCWLASFSFPLAGTTVALAIYLANLVDSAFRSGGLFIWGFMIRVVLLVVLAAGVHAGWRARDLRRQAQRYDKPLAVALAVVVVLVGYLGTVAFPPLH